MPGLVASAAVEGRDGFCGHPAFDASVGWGLVAAFLFLATSGQLCARISIMVIPLSVAWRAVVVAGRGALWALFAFLRGDCPWVCMVVEVEQVSWVEVNGGFVDSIEVVDWGVEVFLRFVKLCPFCI